MVANLLTRARPDARILTNRLLGTLPELERLCIFVDPFDNPENRTANGRALKEAIRHLREGGMLLIFPAGEVSHFDLKKRAICDPLWATTAARLIRITRAKSLQILIQGANGLPFQMLGMVHPRLRTAALPAEMLNKRGKRVEIRIGSAIDPALIEALPDDAEATAYLRFRTELLAPRGLTNTVASPSRTAVATETPQEQLAREIADLPADCRLESARDLEVYIAGAHQVPLALREIGRLREVTFRDAGEGTGEPVDLDRFDPHYLHLFLWNPLPAPFPLEQGEARDCRSIGSAKSRSSSPALEHADSTRRRCSASGPASSGDSDPAWSWVAPSSAPTTNVTTRPCSCSGKASEPLSH
jgi:hypothetical protein